jgi:AraC-like DNA-binding protein
MDALSETLRVVRLVGAIFIQGRFTAPWCYQSPRADSAARLLEPHAERVVIFHLITEGECFVEIDAEPPTRVSAGDVVVFPQGHAHRMCSEPGLQPAKSVRLADARLADVLSRRPRTLVYGGGDARTRLACGYLACDALLARMLLRGLPAEVLFIEVLRLYVNEQSAGRSGWLAAIGDRVVGAALTQLHTRPAHAWTVETLARAAGTSRSVLAARFQQLVGSAPMEYLTQWRMLLAANLLCRSNAALARIAEDVGYQTDTAFIRAFRREYGVPPAAWRRQQSTRVQVP